MIQWIFPDQELAPEITALMMGVSGAKEFYISSLLSSNQIPEITGILMMAVADGAPADEIKSVLTQVASGQLNPEQFHVINKPYVPELPVGIYPGQVKQRIFCPTLNFTLGTLFHPHPDRKSVV